MNNQELQALVKESHRCAREYTQALDGLRAAELAFVTDLNDREGLPWERVLDLKTYREYIAAAALEAELLADLRSLVSS